MVGQTAPKARAPSGSGSSGGKMLECINEGDDGNSSSSNTSGDEDPQHPSAVTEVSMPVTRPNPKEVQALLHTAQPASAAPAHAMGTSVKPLPRRASVAVGTIPDLRTTARGHDTAGVRQRQRRRSSIFRALAMFGVGGDGGGSDGGGDTKAKPPTAGPASASTPAPGGSATMYPVAAQGTPQPHPHGPPGAQVQIVNGVALAPTYPQHHQPSNAHAFRRRPSVLTAFPSFRRTSITFTTDDGKEMRVRSGSKRARRNAVESPSALKASKRWSLTEELLGRSRRASLNPNMKYRSVLNTRFRFLRHIFNPRSPERATWDFLLSLLITFDCVTIPFIAAFPFDAADTKALELFVMLSYGVDVYFALNIFLTMYTIDHDFRLGLIDDPWLIKRRYIGSTAFLTDVVGVFPFELCVRAILIGQQQRGGSGYHHSTLSLTDPRLLAIRATRVVRFWRLDLLLSRLTRNVRMTSNFVGILRCLLFITFTSHILSCMWFAVSWDLLQRCLRSHGLAIDSNGEVFDSGASQQDDSTMMMDDQLFYNTTQQQQQQQQQQSFGAANVTNDDGADSYVFYSDNAEYGGPWCDVDDAGFPVMEKCFWVFASGLHRPFVTNAQRYIQSLYWTVATVTTVGYGDIKGENSVEQAIALVVMLIGSVMFAYVFGLMASLVSSMDSTSRQFKMKVESMERFMDYRGIPWSIRRRIMRYHDIAWIQTKGFDEIGIIKELPSSIQQDVALHLYRDMIMKVPLFQEAEKSFIRAVVLLLEPKIFPSNEYIVRKGDIGREMYFIQNGLCHVLDEVTGKRIASIESGDYFGELSVLFSSRRNASVCAMVETDVLILTKSNTDRILQDFPLMKARLEKMADSRRKETTNKVLNLWRKADVVSELKQIREDHADNDDDDEYRNAVGTYVAKRWKTVIERRRKKAERGSNGNAEGSNKTRTPRKGILVASSSGVVTAAAGTKLARERGWTIAGRPSQAAADRRRKQGRGGFSFGAKPKQQEPSMQQGHESPSRLFGSGGQPEPPGGGGFGSANNGRVSLPVRLSVFRRDRRWRRHKASTSSHNRRREGGGGHLSSGSAFRVNLDVVNSVNDEDATAIMRHRSILEQQQQRSSTSGERRERGAGGGGSKSEHHRIARRAAAVVPVVVKGVSQQQRQQGFFASQRRGDDSDSYDDDTSLSSSDDGNSDSSTNSHSCEGSESSDGGGEPRRKRSEGGEQHTRYDDATTVMRGGRKGGERRDNDEGNATASGFFGSNRAPAQVEQEGGAHQKHNEKGGERAAQRRLGDGLTQVAVERGRRERRHCGGHVHTTDEEDSDAPPSPGAE